MSLNGLNRHSTAPCSSSRGRAVLSVLAVMKIIGISCHVASILLKVRSVHPGHGDVEDQAFGLTEQPDARNSSADEKVRTQSQTRSTGRAGIHAPIHRHQQLDTRGRSVACVTVAPFPSNNAPGPDRRPLDFGIGCAPNARSWAPHMSHRSP